MIGRFPNRSITRSDHSHVSARTLNPLAALPRDVAILLAVLAVIALGVGLYLWRPAALFALLPYALFALCPLGMWLMMRSMNSSNDDTKGTN